MQAEIVSHWNSKRLLLFFSSLKTHGIRQYKYIYSFGARPIWVMGGQTNDKQGCKVVLGGVLGPFKANKREWGKENTLCASWRMRKNGRMLHKLESNTSSSCNVLLIFIFLKSWFVMDILRNAHVVFAELFNVSFKLVVVPNCLTLCPFP